MLLLQYIRTSFKKADNGYAISAVASAFTKVNIDVVVKKVVGVFAFGVTHQTVLCFESKSISSLSIVSPALKV